MVIFSIFRLLWWEAALPRRRSRSWRSSTFPSTTCSCSTWWRWLHSTSRSARAPAQARPGLVLSLPMLFFRLWLWYDIDFCNSNVSHPCTPVSQRNKRSLNAILLLRKSPCHSRSWVTKLAYVVLLWELHQLGITLRRYDWHLQDMDETVRSRVATSFLA